MLVQSDIIVGDAKADLPAETLPRDRAWFFKKGDDAGVLFSDFVKALSVWTWMRAGERPVTVREAATVFQVTDAVIVEAVDEDPWMFVCGPVDDPTQQLIEHDGE